MQNFDCYLLSYVRYGDHDAFLHCYTAESGFQSFFAKGLYSSRNRKKPYLFPLSHLIITAKIQNGENKAATVSRLEPAGVLPDFTDVRMNSLLFFGAEFLHQVLRNEHQNIAAFQLIQRFTRQLSKEGQEAHLKLLIEYLKTAGIAPLISDAPYLDPEKGTFTPTVSHLLFSAEISSLWKKFLTFSAEDSLKLKRSERNLFLDSLLMYYKIHFTGFQVPQAVEVLRELFA